MNRLTSEQYLKDHYTIRDQYVRNQDLYSAELVPVSAITIDWRAQSPTPTPAQEDKKIVRPRRVFSFDD